MTTQTEGAESVRKLIVTNMTSLDGYFEGPTPWDLAFHDLAWGEELEQDSIRLNNDAGMLLFGRKTYEGMANYWSTAEGAVAAPMNQMPKIVFSSTLEKADWNNTTLVKGPAEEEIARLKQQPGKDLLVIGSAELCDSLLHKGLIDEYRVCIAPVLLGSGNPLVKPSTEKIKMHLLSARALQTGAVMLTYRPEVA